MNNELEFGIQTNGIKHTHLDPLPDIDYRFSMVKEANVFDYVDKTPEKDEINFFFNCKRFATSACKYVTFSIFLSLGGILRDSTVTK